MPNDRQLSWLAQNKRRKRVPAPIGEAINIFKQQLDKADSSKLSGAQLNWERIVGTELADLSFPSKLRNGILTVSVATSAATFMLEQLHRTAIVQQLQTELGRQVRDIKCVLQPLSTD